MQVNTAAFTPRLICTTKSSMKIAKPTPDPYTIVDGRYVGHDGFVVPRNFDEFLSRFPRYVRSWVWKHAGTTARLEDVEDWTQELTIHLMALPASSRYRSMGKADLIETFDPQRHYGANAARFWNYINLCLTNRFRTILSARKNDAIRRPGNLALCVLPDDEQEGVNDEFCHRRSAQLRAASFATQQQAGDREVAGEFVAFIERSDGASCRGVVEAILETNSFVEAADSLGMTDGQFERMHRRLRQIGVCFETGAPVPLQRRPNRMRSRD